MEHNGHDLRLSKGGTKGVMTEATDARISDDAVLRVMMEEEKFIREIAAAALEFSHHAGRRTIMEEDIMLAYKYLNR